jgi:hypothetical protein
VQDDILSTIGDALSTLVVLAQYFFYAENFPQKNSSQRTLLWNTKCSLILTSSRFQVYYFLKLPFPICEVCFAKNARFLIPHCQIVNFTSSNCQLHIASATLPTFQIDFIFWAALFNNLIFYPMPKIHSFRTQTRFLWDL